MAERWQQWMPFHIDRFRGSPDVIAMPLEARIGYLYLLASAWQTDDCSIPDDPIALATLSGLGDDLWAIHGPRILRKFSQIIAGRLANSVLRSEWEEARRIFGQKKAVREEISHARSEAGKRGNEKRWAKNRKPIANLSQVDRNSIANDRLTGTGTTTDTEAKTTTPLMRRGCRIPPDFSVTEEHRRLAEEKHYICPDEIIEEFRDYWIGVPGSRGVKLDWDATFRNRMREKTKLNGGTNGTRPQYENQYDRARRRIREEAEREERASYPS